MVMQRDLHEIDTALGDLPLGDRVISLVASMVRRETEGKRAAALLIGLVAAMAHFMKPNERVILAELLRDVADDVEGHVLLEDVYTGVTNPFNTGFARHWIALKVAPRRSRPTAQSFVAKAAALKSIRF
jgi:hypothetical protein